MRLKHTIPALAVAAIAAMTVSCSKSNDSEVTNAHIEFDTMRGSKLYVLDNTAQMFRSEADIAYHDSACIVMPTKIYGIDMSNLHDSIMKIAFDTICPSMDDAMNHYFESVVADLGYKYYEAPDSVERTDWDGLTIVDGDVFNMTANVLTYRITNYSYSPGDAHGITTSDYITYDMRRGEILTLNDLFTPEGLEKLPALIRARAAELKSAIGPTDINALPAAGNFYITIDDNIVFIYQPYEVASFAQGTIGVPFYPYQLGDLMTEKGREFFNL